MFVVLRAHLRGEFHLGRGLGEEPRLGHGMRQRLLAIDVEAATQGADRGRRVMMVGRGHHDGIEALLLQELAIVGVFLGAGVLGGRRVQAALIDVAQSDDVLAGHFGQVAGAAATDADHADIQPLVGAQHARPAAPGERGPGGDAKCQRRLEKTATRKAVGHGSSQVKLGAVTDSISPSVAGTQGRRRWS